MAKGRRQSLARQAKRGHLYENGRVKSALVTRNNRKLNTGSRKSIQLVLTSLKANPKQTRVVKIIRHIG